MTAAVAVLVDLVATFIGLAVAALLAVSLAVEQLRHGCHLVSA
ncbi:MAG TPA: hypothetical protein QGF35_01345 [Dehalococcoidia bacterium]|nr:hypothetical protein [Dehalococcoidia bacterium]